MLVDGQARRLLKKVDIGIAVDTPDGLFVPVLREVNARNNQDLRTGLNNSRADVKSRAFAQGNAERNHYVVHPGTIYRNNDRDKNINESVYNK